MGPDARPIHSSISPITPDQASVSFEFPESHHLVITTEKRVLCLDSDGLSNVFTSSSSGILAAKEAKDERGTLAIADSQVVVLHNLEKGDKSYRLKGTDGQIRLLEYSPNGSKLFFTTTLLNAVQVYSLREQRLLSPGPTHPSPPTVLAISPTSHLLLSCSEQPPIVYIQALVHCTQPTRFQPWVSNAPVVRAAFHRSRPSVFALAFKDGTIAAYDYNKLPRVQPVLSVQRIQGNERQPGEIGHFKQHHAVTSAGLVDPEGNICTASLAGYDDGTKTVAAGARSISVTGIGFISGFLGRCASVGADGKCKIVDFERLNVLREWHIKGPATCLSILSLKMVEEDGAAIIRNRKTVSQISLKAPTPTQRGGPDACQIAVGRVDGKVLIYDMMGNMLRELMVDGTGGRVVDVDWVRGPKPHALDESRRIELMDQTSWIELCDINSGKQQNGQQKLKRVGFGTRPIHQRTISELSVIPSGSERTALSSSGSAPVSPVMKATIENVGEVPELVDDPTDQIFDTVKHYTVRGPIERDVPAISATAYMDLFSPVKPEPSPVVRKESPKRKASVRPRPRVTSSTYISPVGTPQRELGPQETSITVQKSSASEHKLERLPSAKVLKAAKRQPKDTVHRIGTFDLYKHTPGAYITSPSTLMSASSTSSSSSSKILADIKRFVDTSDTQAKPGSLAVFAPYLQVKPKKVETDRRRRKSSTSTSKAKNGRRRSSMLGEVRKVQTEVEHVDPLEDDIWVSGESSSEHKPSSEETRRGRRSKQVPDSKPRHRSRARSGRPRRGYGNKGISEREEARRLPPAKILATQHDDSRSSYFSHQPSIQVSIEPLRNPRSPNDYSPATQSLPSASNGNSITTRESDSDYASSATTSSSIIVSAPSGFAPESVSGSVLSDLDSQNNTGSSSTMEYTSGTTSTSDSEDTIVAPTPNRERLGSVPAVQLPLPPGYAESWAGPVEVENYLPRKGSLAATGADRSPSPSKRRRSRAQTEIERTPKKLTRTKTETDVSPGRKVRMQDVETSPERGESVGIPAERKGPRSPFDRARERKALGDVSGNEIGSPAAKSKVGGGGSRVDSVMKERKECCDHCEELTNEVKKLREEVKSLRRLVKGKGKARGVGNGEESVWVVD